MVNDITVKLAPQGALDQLRHTFSRIIHAFAEAEEDIKIFMAKWDIKDGFWRMDCKDMRNTILLMCFPRTAAKKSH